MAISLNDGNAKTSYPVIRQQKIGEAANLAIIRFEQRDRRRKNPISGVLEPIPNGKDRQGRPKFKQEMVIHTITMPGTTMEARIDDQGGVPAPGDRVRVILKAKGFSDWIEARRTHRRGHIDVGDVLVMETRWAQQYDQDGPTGTKIEDQAAAAAAPRNVTIGFYGPLTLKPGTDKQWIAAAEEAYRADQSAARQPIALAAPYDGDYSEDEV